MTQIPSLPGLERVLCRDLSLTSTPRLICHFEEYFFERNRGEAWRSHRYFYAIDVGGRLNTQGNADDIESAAFLRFEDVRVAPVAVAVIQIARENTPRAEINEAAPTPH